MKEVVHMHIIYDFEKFTEAGHGKRDPDGIGVLIKRMHS